MSIQSLLNDDSISCVPRIEAIIEAADAFDANQMECWTIQSMMNESVCVADKSQRELKQYQNDLIEIFKSKGWLKQHICGAELADFDEDGTTVAVEVECAGQTETFFVQTVDGDYRSDLDCWVTTATSDGDIDYDDYPLFDFDEIIKVAEKYIRSLVTAEWTKYTIDGQRVYLLIRDESVDIVTENSDYINQYTSSYQTMWDKNLGRFNSKEDAIEFLENRKNAD